MYILREKKNLKKNQVIKKKKIRGTCKQQIQNGRLNKERQTRKKFEKKKKYIYIYRIKHVR